MKIKTVWHISSHDVSSDDFNFFKKLIDSKKLYFTVLRNDNSDFMAYGRPFSVHMLKDTIELTSYCEKINAILVLKFGDKLIKIREDYEGLYF